MERRNSDNDEPSRRPNNPDIFDDDYEVDPDEDDFMPSVSDGFRPANTTEASHNDRQNHDRNETPQRHTSTSKPNDADLRRMATRNSIAKVQDAMTPDGRPPHSRAPSGPSPHAHRDSVSSTASFATTSHSENPFETGPSHPYGMYPQHTMARPTSVATTSTERQPQRSMSLQRPTHPYAMYSQSGLVDEEPLEALEEPTRPTVPPVQTAIPVGFPGLNAGYHRVLGPDGEEQDIVGPDGHTEQLPPYTRYPEEGPTKASLAAEASASRIIPAPVPVIDAEDPFTTPLTPDSPRSTLSFSAPALPVAPVLPTVTPARLPPQRPETQTGNLANASSAQVNTIPAEPSDSSSASLLTTEDSFTEKEKAEPDGAKPAWRKRKLWGKIPRGVAVVVLILLVTFAIALGAAIGTIVAKKHSNKNKDQTKHDQPLSQVSGTNGSLFDAIPISTPPGLRPLPTGSFALPLGIPQESNPGCLTQANQYAAWSCKLTFAPLLITINNTSNSGGQQFASTKEGTAVPDGAILYGLQSPLLDLNPLDLVLDLDYKAYGPAYHFATRYDKLVILRPEELNAGAGYTKRQDDKGYRQRFQVRPGDYPWYCWWNATYIEGYIYAQDNSSAATLTALPGTLTTNTAGAMSPNTATSGASTAAASGTQTNPPNAAAATATQAAAVRRDSAADSAAAARMQPYPRIVKIEERRLPSGPQPYCQQMYLLDDGQIALPPNGGVRIWLQEQDPSYEEYISAQATQTANANRKSKRELAAEMQRRSDPSDSCHCQWMFQ